VALRNHVAVSLGYDRFQDVVAAGDRTTLQEHIARILSQRVMLDPMGDADVKATFEMLWVCEFCETKGLLAKTQRCCPECGGKQNADKRYFPKEGEEVQVTGHKYEGADRHCPSCQNPQGAAGKNCTNCGSPMDGSAVVQGVVTAEPPAPKKSKLWILFVVLGIGAVIGIVFGVKYCNRTKDAGGKVLAHSWERTVGIDEYKDHKEEKWRNEIPSDARLVVCHRAQRSTKAIPTGEKKCKTRRVDNKDGTGRVEEYDCKDVTKSEPVMDDKCSFTVTKWIEIEAKKSSGAGMSKTDPPGLPTAAATNTFGAKRVGRRVDVHHLDLDVVGVGKQRCEVNAAAWNKHKDGAQVQLQVSVRTDNVDCDSL